MTVPTSAEMEAHTRKRSEEVRRQRLQAFDRSTLRWLAIVPEWTESLAQTCGFPSDGPEIGELVERLGSSGLCVIAPSVRRGLGRRFWMPASMRDTLLREWSDQEPLMMRNVARLIARRISEQALRGTPVAPGILCWAILTVNEFEAGQAFDGTGDVLLSRVGDCLREGRPEDVTSWLYAAEALEPVVQGPMASAILRAKRRLNLHFRDVRDQRYLRHFLLRRDQFDALDHVISEAGPEWALHFIGRGGAGKTMLLRYLTGPYAQANGLVAARVDFDHLDPRYPTERPGRLLQELAEGLAIYADESQQELFQRGLLLSIASADVAARSQGVDGDHRVLLDRPAMTAVIEGFAAFVRSFERRVVLVLDTCEELAKLHPAGAQSPSIEATFDILCRVREQVPGLVVIFAGRRYLTSHAANWSNTSAALAGTIMSTTPRPFLRVHEIHGLDRDEAWRYLRKVRRLKRPDRDLKAALDRSISSEPRFGEAARFNPYDVAMWADFLNDEDAPSLADFDGDADDLYISAKILEPLASRPDVLDAVPIAVILGRFDARTLEAALVDRVDDPGDVVRRLADEDWVNVSQPLDAESLILDIDEPLLRRLRDFYEDPLRAEQWKWAQATVHPVLLKVLHEATPEGTAPEEVLAAVRVLAPKEAAAGWEELTRRVAMTEAWSWAERVCSRLLAVDEQGSVPRQLRASVRALFAGALLHRDAEFDTRSLWQSVVEEADDHPEEEVAASLRARAELQIVTWRLRFGDTVPDATVKAALNRVRDVEDASVVPALIRLLEALLERPRTGGGVPWRDRRVLRHLRRAAERVQEPEIAIYVKALGARVALRADPTKDPVVEFQNATRSLRGGATIQRWSDWIAPASIQLRVLLEQLRYIVAAGRLDNALMLRCESAALGGLQCADGDRLLSLVAQIRLAHAPLPSESVDRLKRHVLNGPLHPAVAPPHRAAPPLFCAVGEALLALGRAREALDWLMDFERDATESGEADLAREASKAILVTIRRLRVDENLGQVLALCAADHDDVRREALATGALITGVLPNLRGRSISHNDHERWRATDYLSPLSLPAASKELNQQAPAPTRVELTLDIFEEAEVLGRLKGRRALTGKWRRDLEAVAEGQLSPLPPNTDRPLAWAYRTTEARAHALGIPGGRLLTNRPSRGAGLAALDEGALLGLRSPYHAEVLLRHAQDLLRSSDDPIAEFQATLLIAITRIHAGDVRGARSLHYEVRDTFEQAQSWSDELARATSGTDPAELWRGWIARYNAYWSWYEATGAVARRNRQRMLDKGANDTEPAELRLVAAARGRNPIRGLAPGWLLMTIGAIQVVALSAATLGVMAVFIARLLDLGTTIALVAGISVVVASIAALWRQFVPKLWHFAIKRFALDVTIYQLAREAMVEVRLGGRTRAASRYARFSMALTRRLALNRNFGAPPFTFSWRSKDRIDGLKGLGPRRGRRAAALRLAVVPELTAEPWEARLLEDTGSRRGRWEPAQASGVWRRSPVPRRRRTQHSSIWDLGYVSSIAPDQWSQLATLWEDVSRLKVRRLPELSIAQAAVNRGLLIVGSPVATAAGWRLRIEDEITDVAGAREDRRSERQVSPNFFWSGESLIAVLVGIPGGKRPVSEPQIAGGLRGFAGELFSSGVSAVITIPPLPLPLTSELLQTIGVALGGWAEPPATREIVTLVTGLRQQVYLSEPLPEGTESHLERMRVAYDVCLYAGSTVD